MNLDTLSPSVRELSERSLPRDEFNAWVNAPMSPHEREEPLERLDEPRRMTRDAMKLRELPRRQSPT